MIHKTTKTQFTAFIFFVTLLFCSFQLEAQIIAGTNRPNPDPAGPPGNPDAIIPINAVLGADGRTFQVQGAETCITGDGVNNGSPGEDPEWRFDVTLADPGNILPVSEDIEIRVCRRGDFGQAEEVLIILDENLNEVGRIPGQGSLAFDCTAGPICQVVSISSCAFNAQTADGVFSLTLYTDGANSGNTVGDFCDVPPGPQTDETPAGCTGDCLTYSQSVPSGGGRVFNNQANGGPMVNNTATDANCAFIDYFIFPTGGLAFTIDGTDADDLDGEDYCVGESLFIPSASGAGQQFTVSIDGGPRQTVGGGGMDVNYTFTAPGTYEICNIVDPGGCAEEKCITLNVIDTPPGNAGPDDAICQNQGSYDLSGAVVMADNVQWTSSGDGFYNDPTADNPTYFLGSTDVNAAVIQLSVTVFNDDGICDPATDSLILTVNDVPIVDAGAATALCSDNGAYTLSDATIGGGATTGTWSLTTSPATGDGVLSSTAATATPETVTFTATVPGDYVLTLTSDFTAPCVAATDTVTITVEDEPTVTVASPTATICFDDMFTVAGSTSTNGTIAWTTSGTGTFDNATIENPVYTASTQDVSAGVVTLTKTVTGTGACASSMVSASIALTISEEPTVEAGAAASLCSDAGPYTLSDATIGGGATMGTWSLTTSPATGDGVLSSTAATATPETVTFTATVPGDYILTLTSDFTAPCVAATDTVTITVEDEPTVTVASPTATICFDDMFTVAGSTSTNGTIAWTTSGSGSFTDNTIDNPVYTASALDVDAGVITLTKTVTGTGACASSTVSASIALTISEEPTVEAGAAASLCSDNGAYILSDATIGGGATTGTWSLTTSPAGGDGALSSTAATATPETVTFTATVPGDYILTLTSDFTAPCVAATDTVTITVEDEPTVTVASPTATICFDDMFTVAGSTSTNGTIAWTTSGSGSFTDNYD